MAMRACFGGNAKVSGSGGRNSSSRGFLTNRGRVDAVVEDRNPDERGLTQYDYCCYGSVIALFIHRLDRKVKHRFLATFKQAGVPSDYPGRYLETIRYAGKYVKWQRSQLEYREFFLRHLRAPHPDYYSPQPQPEVSERVQKFLRDMDQDNWVLREVSLEDLLPAVELSRQLAYWSEKDLFGDSPDFRVMQAHARLIFLKPWPLPAWCFPSRLSAVADVDGDSPDVEPRAKYRGDFLHLLNKEALARAGKVAAAGGFPGNPSLVPLFEFERPHAQAMVDMQVQLRPADAGEMRLDEERDQVEQNPQAVLEEGFCIFSYMRDCVPDCVPGLRRTGEVYHDKLSKLYSEDEALPTKALFC